MQLHSRTRGFTLIELLTVVSIIALMSAAILSALTLARSKAQDAAVRREMTELRTIMARELNDTGSYANIKKGGVWKGATDVCTTAGVETGHKVGGAYAAEAKRVCDALIKATSGCTSSCVFFGEGTSGDPIFNVGTKFSIMSYLPGASRMAGDARLLCMGSSGNVSVANGGAGSTLTEPGCSNNP